MQQEIITKKEFQLEVLKLSTLTTEEMFKELLGRIMILEKVFVLLCRKLGVKKSEGCKNGKCKKSKNSNIHKKMSTKHPKKGKSCGTAKK